MAVCCTSAPILAMPMRAISGVRLADVFGHAPGFAAVAARGGLEQGRHGAAVGDAAIFRRADPVRIGGDVGQPIGQQERGALELGVGERFVEGKHHGVGAVLHGLEPGAAQFLLEGRRAQHE